MAITPTIATLLRLSKDELAYKFEVHCTWAQGSKITSCAATHNFYFVLYTLVLNIMYTDIEIFTQ